MTEKDLTAKPLKTAPPLFLESISSDAASEFTEVTMGPEALRAAQSELEHGRGTTSPPAPIVPASPSSQTKAGAAPTVTAQTDPVKTERVPSPERKKTVYPTQAGWLFLSRMRRPYKIARAFVAEYALMQLFAALPNEAIAGTLRAVGHGRRRARDDRDRGPTFTVYLDSPTADRLERLLEDHNVAEGIVVGYAIDWLRAHNSEESIVAAMRERGFGLRRPTIEMVALSAAASA
jgi:hypothetical protein